MARPLVVGEPAALFGGGVWSHDEGGRLPLFGEADTAMRNVFIMGEDIAGAFVPLDVVDAAMAGEQFVVRGLLGGLLFDV